MTIPRTRIAISIACLLSLSFAIFALNVEAEDEREPETEPRASVLPIVAFALLAAALLVVAARATLLTWITVLVLLAFAGKRRRFLVRRGRRITKDVAVHLFKVLVRERGVVAVACATAVSFMAVLGLSEI